MAHIGNSELVTTVNSRLVLQAVRMLQPTYRAEVSRHTMLKPATVTRIVNELVEDGLLVERPAAPTPGAGGRPPVMLSIDPEFRQIIAIDIEPDTIRVARTNLLAEKAFHRDQFIDRYADGEVICEQLLALLDELLEGVDRESICGVGVSLPGLIDAEAGIALSSTNMPRWRNVPIRQILHDHLGLPVHMGRSIHLAALHESWIHPEHSDETTVAISLRTGVGVATMRHGEIYVGHGGFDGEIGHTVIDINGLPCECGSRGCLETLVSSTAIKQRAQEMIDQGRCEAISRRLRDGDSLRPELIYRLAKTGDPDCAEIVREVGTYIGIAASNMINLMAPDHLVICGSVDTADELILGQVRHQVERSALPAHREHVQIRLSEARERSPLLGAAARVAQQWFELPRLR